MPYTVDAFALKTRTNEEIDLAVMRQRVGRKVDKIIKQLKLNQGCWSNVVYKNLSSQRYK